MNSASKPDIFMKKMRYLVMIEGANLWMITVFVKLVVASPQKNHNFPYKFVLGRIAVPIEISKLVVLRQAAGIKGLILHANARPGSYPLTTSLRAESAEFGVDYDFFAVTRLLVWQRVQSQPIASQSHIQTSSTNA
jgi:hypothetical protein